MVKSIFCNLLCLRPWQDYYLMFCHKHREITWNQITWSPIGLEKSGHLTYAYLLGGDKETNLSTMWAFGHTLTVVLQF